MLKKKPVAKATFPKTEPSFGHRHYVPILKSKSGELWALEHTNAEECSCITPLLEVHRERQKTVAEHVARVMSKVVSAWGGRPLFLDTCLYGVSDAAATNAAVTIFAAAASAGLQFVPVTSLDRSTVYQATIATHLTRGVMIRLSPDDFTDIVQLRSRLTSLLNLFSLPQERVDILIDCGAVGAPAIQSSAIKALVDTLPSLSRWRTLTVSGSAFPASIATQPPNRWNILPRREWVAWSTAVTASLRPKRLPTYGDYGVRDTAPPAEFGSSYANLRYTSGSLYLVRRNSILVKNGGSTDIYPICSSLRSRPEFSGPAFSAGDEMIDVTALQQSSPGNAGNWTQWAMNHHFATVVAEILTLLAA